MQQPGWRKCGHCKGLFYDGYEGKGACPGNPRRATGVGADGAPIYSGGGHGAEPGGPDFLLAFDMPPRPGQQNDWRFCDRCLGLFFYRTMPMLIVRQAEFTTRITSTMC